MTARATPYNPLTDAPELALYTGEDVPGWDDEIGHGDLAGAIPRWNYVRGDEHATIYRTPRGLERVTGAPGDLEAAPLEEGAP